MQCDKSPLSFGANSVEIIGRDASGKVTSQFVFAVPNGENTSSIIGKIVGFLTIPKDYAPAEQLPRRGVDKPVASVQNTASSNQSLVAPYVAPDVTTTQNDGHMEQDNHQRERSYIQALQGGNQTPSFGQRIPIFENRTQGTGQVPVRREIDPVTRARYSTVPDNDDSQGEQVPRPRLRTGPVMRTRVVDPNNKEHWKIKDCWQGRMVGGARIPLGWVFAEARKFPKAKFRYADYIWPSGKAIMCLWFEADAAMDDAIEFMEYLCEFVVPLDPYIMPPNSYDVIASKVNPVVGPPKQKNPRAEKLPKRGGNPAGNAPSDKSHRDRMTWGKDDAGIVVRLNQCDNMEAQIKTIKASLQADGMAADKVFMQRVIDDPQAWICYFHRDLPDEDSVLMITYIAAIVGSKVQVPIEQEDRVAVEHDTEHTMNEVDTTHSPGDALQGAHKRPRPEEEEEKNRQTPDAQPKQLASIFRRANAKKSTAVTPTATTTSKTVHVVEDDSDDGATANSNEKQQEGAVPVPLVQP